MINMGKEIKKEISNLQLFITILSLSTIGIFLLIISGIFDTPEPNIIPNTNNNLNQQNQQSVDLNKIVK